MITTRPAPRVVASVDENEGLLKLARKADRENRGAENVAKLIPEADGLMDATVTDIRVMARLQKKRSIRLRWVVSI